MQCSICDYGLSRHIVNLCYRGGLYSVTIHGESKNNDRPTIRGAILGDRWWNADAAADVSALETGMQCSDRYGGALRGRSDTGELSLLA